MLKLFFCVGSIERQAIIIQEKRGEKCRSRRKERHKKDGSDFFGGGIKCGVQQNDQRSNTKEHKECRNIGAGAGLNGTDDGSAKGRRHTGVCQGR